MRGLNNNSGIMLLSVLWILTILSLLALSLGRSAGMEISLMQYSIAKVKAYAAARAGINKALNLLARNGSLKDTLFSSGILMDENKTPEEYFRSVKVSDQAYFHVSYRHRDGEDSKTVERYGVTDELRRINLNDLAVNNFLVLSFLMQDVGVERSLADRIAASAVDWRDEDSELLNADGVQGAENEYYGSLTPSYKTKNKSYDAPEELMMVKGMTPEIYAKIKDYLTVFPKMSTGTMQINLNTAPQAVYSAFFMQAARQQQAVDSSVFAQAVKQAQQGKDGVPFTSDDGQSGAVTEAFNLAAQAAHHNEKSQYYRIRSVGTDDPSGVRVTIEAVVGPDETGEDWMIRSWHRLN